MRYSTARNGVGLLVATSIVVATTAVADAQRRREANPNPTVPLATDVIAANPGAYYGKLVTISAGVEEVLSNTAFTVDQKHIVPGSKEVISTGQPILVIAPSLNGPLDRKNYMLFVGELVKLDSAAVAQRKLALAPELLARFQDRPVLVATAVIDAQYVDHAKLPLSAEEVALSAVMRRISPVFAALARAAAGSDATVVTDSASALTHAFGETEPFWKQRPDALKWAHDARQQAEAIQAAVAANNWPSVKSAADTLGKTCQGCHEAHRERLSDGTFRIKPTK